MKKFLASALSLAMLVSLLAGCGGGGGGSQGSTSGSGTPSTSGTTTGNVIKIGAMCTLRQIEECEALKEMYGDGIAESVRHIVGVQFRNQATVGGSIYGRFGFSDVLTAFLALDTFVELYDGGTIRLSEFVNRKPDKDILLSVIVRKSKRNLNGPSAAGRARAKNIREESKL